MIALSLSSCSAKKVINVSQGVVILPDSSSCLAGSEFQLDNIKLSSSVDLIIQQIGEPNSITVDNLTKSDIWHYSDLDIGISNNLVNLLRSKDTLISTPSGLKLGMTKTEVSSSILAQNQTFNETFDKNDEVQVFDCDMEYSLFLNFKNDLLIELEMYRGLK